MDTQKDLEEKLREAACIGDEAKVQILLHKGININSQHAINGWSALHWAAKRGHVGVTTRLLQSGASKTLKTFKGETAVDLTLEPTIRRMITGEVNGNAATIPELAITPNYLKNPPFPYCDTPVQKANTAAAMVRGNLSPEPCIPTKDEELVLKVRLVGTGDPDFIEVELLTNNLSFDYMLSVLAKELNVDKRAIQKVRKLPNTIVRKDKDVKRLKDFQELEVILTTYVTSQHSRTTGGPMPRHIDVVY